MLKESEPKVEEIVPSAVDEISILSDKSGVTVSESVAPNHLHSVHRRLRPRHIQLIGIGGTIGTVLFVQMGNQLIKSGPAMLFMGFALWCIPVVMLTMSTSEMVTRFPLPSPFIRLAGRCVDQSLEVMAGWNFFILEALLVPFEITAVTLIIHYWRTDFTPAAAIVPQIALYIIINLVCPVVFFGEIEYWLAIFKVILMVGLLLFTFITMVGGNPQHNAYGFTFWKNPGAFKEFWPGTLGELYDNGEHVNLGRFLAFASAVSLASYVIAGPDYVSMTAGEAINPRKVLPRAYRGVVIRLTVFFAMGALAMGIVCAHNDPLLKKAYADGGGPGASGSPYVVAMVNMGIKGLPSVVNVGVLSAAFSAGNSYFYCASRTLYGLALDGKAPKIFSWCTPNGVPWCAALAVTAIAMLSFLQMSSGANQVLQWIISIGTAAELINYSIMSFTFIRFFRACKVQNIDRRSFSFRGWCQPYQAYFAFFCTFSMVFCSGWVVFVRGNWSITSFAWSYIMIPIDLAIFIFWKVFKRTKFLRAHEIDMYTGLAEVAEHERHLEPPPPRKWWQKIIAVISGDS